MCCFATSRFPNTPFADEGDRRTSLSLKTEEFLAISCTEKQDGLQVLWTGRLQPEKDTPRSRTELRARGRRCRCLVFLLL